MRAITESCTKQSYAAAEGVGLLVLRTGKKFDNKAIESAFREAGKHLLQVQLKSSTSTKETQIGSERSIAQIHTLLHVV